MNPGILKLQKCSFLTLVEQDPDLAALRQEHARCSPKERRMAADWHYHAAIAAETIGNSLVPKDMRDYDVPIWPAGIVALAIDPLFAPALLTVGSIEFQLGRPKEAMSLFMKLTELPKDEVDLPAIIDKAGDFLLDEHAYENALALYLAAEDANPSEPLYLIGSGFCLVKLGHLKESVEKHRKAVALEPENYIFLNDLGYALLEAGEFDEAEEMLQKSLLLAPADYEFPRNNLEYLSELKQQSSPKQY